MRIIGQSGCDNLAVVYMAETAPKKYVEFVESLQPPFPREEKWVLIVSTMYGCPVGCAMCDAGGWYKGKISTEDILAQIDYPVLKRYPDRHIPAGKFKIQFARMGEPSLNENVLTVLDMLPERYGADGLMPCLSTVAPAKASCFFDRLIEIKNNAYGNGHFQFQFSVHSTDDKIRDKIMPVPKWSLEDMARYGEKYFRPGDRKLTLNFALAENCPVSPDKIADIFDPDLFLIKTTPINPTLSAQQNGINNSLNDRNKKLTDNMIEKLRKFGFDVIVSVGELEENRIGSNCGQYIRRFLNDRSKIDAAYEYEIVA